MSEYDDRRVEPRTALMGIGMGVTPERLHEIEQRRKELEKVQPKEPVRSFGEVMASTRSEREVESREIASAEEGEAETPPKSGCRLGFTHPAQRTTYGREGTDNEVVVLKG